MKISLFLILLSIYCSNPVDAVVLEHNNYPFKNDNAINNLQKGRAQDQQASVAKFAIAALMGRPASTIKISKQGAAYIASYIRGSDGQRFSYKLKFAGNNIQWGNSDGRWRNQSADEKLTYAVKNKKVTINIHFGDGSKDTQTFKL